VVSLFKSQLVVLTWQGVASSDEGASADGIDPPSKVRNPTNRLSRRLKCVFNRVRVDPWGSLRVADSAAQLNSMLEFPKLHVDDGAFPVGRSIDGEKS
jgi:hypothetical protein